MFKNNEGDKSNYVGYPLIKLYSELSHPDKCRLCFPYLKDNDELESKLTDETNIFLTHDNFETPNLLLNFPKFGYTIKNDVELLKAHTLQIARKDSLRFSELFKILTYMDIIRLIVAAI
ncbi:MAG: hypothetical protein IPH42_10980 [Bacteroidetes bacterium]|nr:hypothetical protein [Bacteroidota bacterium]